MKEKGQTPEGIQPGQHRSHSTTPAARLHVVFVPTRRHLAPIVAHSPEKALETTSRLWEVPVGRLVYLWDYPIYPMEAA